MDAFPGEAELVRRRAQAGEAAAFVAIYERCQPSIYTHVYYRVGDERVAEDVTSEVFVRLVDKIQTFTYTGRPILAWLYTIASNLVADHHRRNGQITHVPLDEQLLSEETDLLTHTQQHLTQTQLVAALRHLTDEQRRVIIFRFVEDRSNAEIAALLGKNEGAVKALQHRALAALRRLLKLEQPYEAA